MPTYKGSCHCGAYKFSVELELEGIVTCNCSICARTGYMLAFVAPDKLYAETDEGALREYRFHKKRIVHMFCTTCGVHPIGKGNLPDGRDVRFVNIRCLEGVELDEIPTKRFDGRSL